MRLDHAHDAPNLVSVTVQHGGQVLLRVVESEPSPLAEVGSLAGCLEMQPGLRVELVRRARVLDLGGGVVGREEVFDNGSGFPESDVGVRVFDGRDAAVRVDALERFLLNRVSLGY